MSMYENSSKSDVSRRSFLRTVGVTLSGSLYMRFASSDAFAARSPQYMVPFTDPMFGSRVTKVTNPNNPVPGLDLTWGNIAIHHYSIDQAWNADQTLLRLDRGTAPKIFLDGHTYKPLMALKSPGDIRWHRVQPDHMVFLSDQGVGLWNVRKNTTQILDPLSGYTGANFGKNKGNLSDDGTMLAILANRADGKAVVFAYNLVTGERHPDIDLSAEHRLGWTTISPSGSYIVSYSQERDTDAHHLRRIFAIDGRLIQTWSEYERPGHGDFMIDRDGDEVAIGRSKSEPDKYRIIKRRLVDGKVTTISPPCYASHCSVRNLGNPGWVFATFTPNAGKPGYAPFNGEVTALATDGTGRARRLAQTNVAPNGYYTEPHGSPSPDGKKAIFSSNWGVSTGPIAAYVAEFL